jgi:hypothetical protein
MPSGAIGDFKSPMLNAATVSGVISQYVPGNHLGVPSRFLVPWQFLTIGIGNSRPPAHDDIEKVSRHGRKI